MVDKRIYALLKSLDFTEYEAKAYLCLSSHLRLSAEELSTKAAIPLTRTYGVLESLAEKGFVRTNLGRPRSYEVTPPELAVKSFLEYQRDESEGRLKKLKEAGEELLEELEPKYWEKRYKISPEELLQPLPDLKSAEEETVKLIHEAESSVYILSAVFGWAAKAKDEILKALDRGVRCRLLLMSPEADVKTVGSELKSPNFEVRRGSDFWYPMRETVADRRRVVFVIWASTDKETFWHPITYKPHLSSHPGIVRAFSDVFERMWIDAS